MVLAALVATGCRHESDPALSGDLTAFTVTDVLGIACTGVWVVDRDGALRWLTGYAEPSRDSPFYPSFQHDGRLTVGLFSQPDTESTLPLIDIVAVENGEAVASDVLPISFTWSPSRAQLLALVLKPGRKYFSLVLIDAGSGRTTTVAENAAPPLAWLGNGDSIAYLAIANDESSLWVASADGSDARLLARRPHEQFAASPDGKRIAFRRSAKQSFRDELWMVDVETGKQRRVPGSPLRDRIAPDVWAGRETLVVHDAFPGGGSDANDAIRVDVGSGGRSLLAPDAEVLEASPDGSFLLAIREHVLGVDREQEVISVLTMRSDGTNEHLLAVTDAESENIASVPTLQPVAHELSVASDMAPPPEAEARCRSELIALRERVRKG